jgi:hypothetical protein
VSALRAGDTDASVRERMIFFIQTTWRIFSNKKNVSQIRGHWQIGKQRYYERVGKKFPEHCE